MFVPWYTSVFLFFQWNSKICTQFVKVDANSKGIFTVLVNIKVSTVETSRKGRHFFMKTYLNTGQG